MILVGMLEGAPVWQCPGNTDVIKPMEGLTIDVHPDYGLLRFHAGEGGMVSVLDLGYSTVSICKVTLCLR